MDASGPWSAERIRAHLEETVVSLRLAVLSASGHPRVVSLWYLLDEGALWCATAGTSRVARWLEREPRCGFEVARDEPPYRGVRGAGMARLGKARGEEILCRLLDRYLGSRETPLARWLLSRASQEVAIRIEPERLTSWDFSRRMRNERAALRRGSGGSNESPPPRPGRPRGGG